MAENIPGGFRVEDFEFMPRKDLLEPAFRRYEKLIARAIEQDYVVDPKELGTRMNARTFVARFNDAKRGYTLYGYESQLIPKAFNLMFIKAVVGKNGMVLIYNEFGKTKGDLMSGLVVPEPVKMVLPGMQTQIDWWEGVDQKNLETVTIDFEALDQLVQFLAEDELQYKGKMVIVNCKNELEKTKAIAAVKKGRSWLQVMINK